MIQHMSGGKLQTFINGIERLVELEEEEGEGGREGEREARVLIAEACNHVRIPEACEDIGLVQLPKAIKKAFPNLPLQIHHAYGREFPFEALREGEGGREGGREGGGGYDVVVHCGGCMIDRQKIRARMEECEEAGVAMTNYGLLLAYAAGPEAFLRAVKPFGVLVPPKLLAHAAALEIKRKKERDGEGGKEGGREEEAPSCVNSACALCPGGEVGRKGVLCKCMIDEQKNE